MTVVDAGPRPLTLRLARDYDPAAATLPGMDLGSAELTGAPGATVARWFADGVRKVTLPQTVDLTADGGEAAATMRALLLVRELTARGVAVEWRLRLSEDAADWQLYSHLHPPIEVYAANGDPGAVDADTSMWRRTFYIDKCAYRRGPGFVQIRDRRAGVLKLLTIDDPAYLAALDMLQDGAPLSGVNLDIAQEFAAEGLVSQIGELLVWLPYRLRRWPLPSMIV